jgi:SAM-dependent methyltransferase
MNLDELIHRNPNPSPWAEGEKIPWSDPAFSRRMLKEHLTQKHDAASRRTGRIKKHVDWIDHVVLAEKPSRILDLGCGPGLYATRLATLGHETVGIDFSPASIEYAVKHSSESCAYVLGDIRKVDFGADFDLIVFIFGEFNVFKKTDANKILHKAFDALKPKGKLLLEVSTFDSIYDTGNQPAMWYSSKSGLFSDESHLCLMESFWDDVKSAAIERYYIVESESGDVTAYASSSQAYTDQQYINMLKRAGFRNIALYPSLTGRDDEVQEGMQVIIAQK